MDCVLSAGRVLAVRATARSAGARRKASLCDPHESSESASEAVTLLSRRTNGFSVDSTALTCACFRAPLSVGFEMGAR